ncbi:CHAT domain protein [Ceratobasidium sp. AG-Ba]|nr:CHAT domain protein [Ceratobasidium sp. AG-Ba]
MSNCEKRDVLPEHDLPVSGPDTPGSTTSIVEAGIIDEWSNDTDELNSHLVEMLYGLSDTPAVSDGPEGQLQLLEAVSAHLQDKYQREIKLELLDKSIACARQALRLSDRRQFPIVERLRLLGALLCRRFSQSRVISDLNEAIDNQTRATTLSIDDDILHGACLSSLGVSLNTRFDWLGVLADSTESIKCGVKAVEMTRDGHPNKPDRLSNLGISCQSRFMRLGELTDLDRAIGYQSQAVDLTPDSHPDKPSCLNNLGNSWNRRFERLGELADLDCAMECQSRAVDLTSGGHPNKPDSLSNLGNSYHSRFERLGELEDLDHAIGCQSQAADLTPDDHPDKPCRLNDLGNSWQSRFERLGDLADLDRAIDCQSRAVDLTPDGHPDKPSCLNDLGNSWHRRFERLGELADLDHAIGCQSQAVDLTPDDYPRKLAHLINLGSSYQHRFEHLGELADLKHALDCQSRAVDLTPDSHPDKPGRLNGLGNSWQSRFERLGELADLDHAIESKSRAVDLTPDGHPDKPGRLKNLGLSLQSRFLSLHQIVDLRRARDAYRAGALENAFRPSVQMSCAREWAKIDQVLDGTSPDAYQAAFSLLPRLVWIGQTIHHRHETMVSVRDLAAEAAAWAISAHLYGLALEWLEQWRSVVWGQSLQLRSQIQELSSADDELAQALRDTASQLDIAGFSSTSQRYDTSDRPDLVFQAARRHQLASEWDELLERARLIPGFENFMQPLKSKELKRAAKDGPVVVINTYHAQCDALIILPNCGDITHVPLTGITQEKLEWLNSIAYSMRSEDRSLDEARGFTRNNAEDISRLPEYLWSDIVAPVLDKLGYMGDSKADELPHVTWCTSGEMSFLPLHAAGLSNGSPKISDIVVSSYAPTLTSLILHNMPPCTQSGLVAVGPEASTEQTTLPKTADELKVISKYKTITSYNELKGDAATVDATLAAMQENSWVHLACRAVQDNLNPNQSAFHLYGGKLTLEEISRRRFKNKGLAFLSVCQTATGDRGLSDEATHLATGMLMAGYPSVIGTMWSIIDEDAPLVADIVYSELLKDGKMDHTASARALHKAVKALREKVGEKEIERWAPFIHVGV